MWKSRLDGSNAAEGDFSVMARTIPYHLGYACNNGRKGMRVS
jgi:hypothetical protein